MITAIFIYAGALIIQIFHLFLSAISFVIPDTFEEMIFWVFSSVHLLDGLLPVNDILLAIITVITAYEFIYGLKILMWVISYVPFIGHRDLPNAMDHGDKNFKGTKK